MADVWYEMELRSYDEHSKARVVAAATGRDPAYVAAAMRAAADQLSAPKSAYRRTVEQSAQEELTLLAQLGANWTKADSQPETDDDFDLAGVRDADRIRATEARDRYVVKLRGEKVAAEIQAAERRRRRGGRNAGKPMPPAEVPDGV